MDGLAWVRLDKTYRAGRPIVRQVLKMRILKFPRLVGRYCNYLLPKQTSGTTQILVFKTLRTIGRPALYIPSI